MASKVTKNTFEGGMNKDVDLKKIASNQFSDALNVSLSGARGYGAVSLSRGPKVLQTMLTTFDIDSHNDIHIMGLYEARLKTAANTYHDAIVIFIYNDKTSEEFEVQFYDIDTNTLYQAVFTDAVDRGSSARTVDAVVFREGDVDYIYFTDYFTAPKKLPVDISSQSTYLAEEIYLQRAGFRGVISLSQITDGTGNLLCGTYQFTARLFNSDTNRYTKWLAFLAPVVIKADTDANDAEPYAGVGLYTNKYISIAVNTKVNYLSGGQYTHCQFAVIENINGDKASTLTAKILEPVVIGGTTTSFTYKSNTQDIDTLTTIDELTVDDAPIQALRTLAIKHNRLIGGGIKYHPLDYDNGDPVLNVGTSSTISNVTIPNIGYESDIYSSTRVSYFRDEVYRFAISYFDEFGNFSRPKVLDMSSVLLNAASSGIDLKFPDRSDKIYGPLITSSNLINVLRVTLNGIDNHPTWAKGFTILRAPRKKKVLFQTPLIPSILVQPAQARGSYPDQRKDENNNFLDVLNVSTANPKGTYVPKNFHHGLPKSLINQGDFYNVTGNGGGLYTINDSVQDLVVKSPDQGSWLIPIVSTEFLIFTYPGGVTSDVIAVWKSDSVKVTSGDPAIVVTLFRELIATDGFPTYPASPHWSGTPPYTTDADTIATLDPSTYKYLIRVLDV